MILGCVEEINDLDVGSVGCRDGLFVFYICKMWLDMFL